jgi:hypothetical protein
MNNFVNLVQLYEKDGSIYALKSKHYLLNQSNNNPIDDHLGYTANATFVNKSFTWMIGVTDNKQILLTRADDSTGGTTLLKALSTVPFELQYLGKMKVTTDMNTLNIVFSLTSTSVYVNDKAAFEETTLKPLIEKLLTEKGLNVNVMNESDDIIRIPDITNLILEKKADVYNFKTDIAKALEFKENIKLLHDLQHQLKNINPTLQKIKEEKEQIQEHTLRLNELESGQDIVQYKETLSRIRMLHDILQSERPMTLGSAKRKRKTKNVVKNYGKSRRVK